MFFCRTRILDGTGTRLAPLQQEQEGLLPDWLATICAKQTVYCPAVVVRRATYETVGVVRSSSQIHHRLGDVDQDRGSRSRGVSARAAGVIPRARRVPRAVVCSPVDRFQPTSLIGIQRIRRTLLSVGRRDCLRLAVNYACEVSGAVTWGHEAAGRSHVAAKELLVAFRHFWWGMTPSLFLKHSEALPEASPAGLARRCGVLPSAAIVSESARRWIGGCIRGTVNDARRALFARMAAEASSERCRDLCALDARGTASAGPPRLDLHYSAGRAGGRCPRRGGIARDSAFDPGCAAETTSPSERSLEWGRRLAATVLRVHRRTPIDVFEMEESFGWMADVHAITSHSDGRQAARAGLPFAGRGGTRDATCAGEDRARRACAHAHGLRDLAGAAHPGRDHCALRPQAGARPTHRQSPVAAGFCTRLGVGPLRSQASSLRRPLRQAQRRRCGAARLRCSGDGSIHRCSSPSSVRTAGSPIRTAGASASTTRARPCAPSRPGSRIDYRGGLDPQKIYPLRANAYLTIVASRWENQSYTALEAMAQGCPLVSSDAGGQSEFVVDGSTGLLAKAGSDDDLRQAHRDPAARPARARPSSAGARASMCWRSTLRRPLSRRRWRCTKRRSAWAASHDDRTNGQCLRHHRQLPHRSS